MKRWTLAAACALAAAGCTDGSDILTPGPDARPSLISTAGAVLDPVLTGQLSLAAPTDRLEVIVNFDEALTSGPVLGGLVRTLGAGVVTFHHLPMVAAVATPAEISSIRGLPGVTSMYANRPLRYLLAESNRSIRSDQVWAMGFTGKGVGVAILDSGVDGLYSPGLQYPSKTIANVKYIGDLGDIVDPGEGLPKTGGALFVENVPTSETSTGHGTHVAGIAAGDGGGSTSGLYRGVAPGASVIGIGTGDVLFVFWALAGFDYILDHQEEYNIQVVNNSWGTTGAYDPEDPINRATRRVHDAGVAVVFAAGNEGPGENTLNPYSAAPWVISVAAGCKTVSPDPTGSAAECNDGRAGQLADFSSRGVAGDPLVHPDVTAPGVNIVSTRAALGSVMNGLDLPSDAQTCNIGVQHVQYYTCASGTSMASPHVAGVIALLEEASGGRLTPDQAYNALIRTARPMLGYSQWEVGSGYVDALAAVKYVRRGN
jgi:serine protease AprX